MKNLMTRSFLVSILCLVGTANCQEQAFLARTYSLVPKKGQSEAFEEAFKAHIKWAKENGEPWNWTTYQIMLGDELGRYVCVSPGHKASDFDTDAEYRRRSTTRFSKTVSPYLESIQGGLYWLHKDLSHLKGLKKQNPYITVTTFKTKPLANGEFLGHFAKRHAAKMTLDVPAPTLTYSMISGGRGRVISVTPFASWAMAAANFRASQKVIEGLGSDVNDEIRKGIQATTSEVTREIFALRPDMCFEASPSVETVSVN